MAVHGLPAGLPPERRYSGSTHTGPHEIRRQYGARPERGADPLRIFPKFPKNLIFFQKRTQPWLNLNLYHPSLPLHIFKSPISLIFLEFIPSLLCTIRGCCLFFFFLRDFLPQTFLSLQEPKTSKNHSHTYTQPIFTMVRSSWISRTTNLKN